MRTIMLGEFLARTSYDSSETLLFRSIVRVIRGALVILVHDIPIDHCEENQPLPPLIHRLIQVAFPILHPRVITVQNVDVLTQSSLGEPD